MWSNDEQGASAAKIKAITLDGQEVPVGTAVVDIPAPGDEARTLTVKLTGVGLPTDGVLWFYWQGQPVLKAAAPGASLGTRVDTTARVDLMGWTAGPELDGVLGAADLSTGTRLPVRLRLV